MPKTWAIILIMRLDFLSVQLTTAVSAQRPSTLTQQATLALLTELAAQWWVA